MPFVRVGDIDCGRVRLGALKRIDARIAEQYPRTRLRGGELLLTIVGTIGRVAVVPASLAGANTARAVAVVPLVEDVSAEWAAVWFRNPGKVREMTAKAHEVARKTLNLEDVREASIALPPVPEQQRILAEVERRLSAVEEVESMLEVNLKRSDRLRQAILKQAFEGKLVRQDPTDEPALVTLDRIRLEREGAAPQRRLRRFLLANGRLDSRAQQSNYVQGTLEV